MTYLFSRLVEVLLTPTNFIVILIGLGLALGLARRTNGFGRGLVTLASLALAVLAITPAGDALLAPLEARFPPFQADGRQITGIVVLGGSLSETVVAGVLDPRPDQSADRLFEAARVARRFPDARVLVSGGPEYPGTIRSEADFVAGYLSTLGVSPGRIVRERNSRNTFENARFSAALVHPRPSQRWLLVTSAFHMPRAVACFRKAGFTVEAAPADWRGNALRWPFEDGSWSATGNLGKVDLAWKEYLGLLAYRLEGRTDTLFPGP